MYTVLLRTLNINSFNTLCCNQVFPFAVDIDLSSICKKNWIHHLKTCELFPFPLGLQMKLTDNLKGVVFLYLVFT